jgi:two-component system, NarL family, sensor kinase
MPTAEEVIFITLVGTFSALLLSVTLFIFYISYQKRKFRYIREKQALHTQEQHLRTELEIQEQTFQAISQEIHDNIGQMLSLVKLNLNTTDVSNPETAKEKIFYSKELVSKSIADLRDLSKSLNAEIIKEIGLDKAIQRELLLVSKSGQYETGFRQEGEPFRLDPDKELILFRIFQEILSNVINHAKARAVNALVSYKPDRFTLVVSDDGKGFDASTIEANESHLNLGIRNMHNRASLIGADFKLTSEIGKGTRIMIELPLEPMVEPVTFPGISSIGVRQLSLANPQ